MFPLGNYTKLTLKNDSLVGNLHVLSNNSQPQNLDILNWHPVPITEITTLPDTTQTVVSPNVPADSTNPSQTTSTTNGAQSSPNSHTSTTSPTGTDSATTSPTSPVSPTPTPLPEQLITNLEQPAPETVIINIGLEEKTAEVLKHLSIVKREELSGGSLEQYATTEEKTLDDTLTAIKFDFYFLKFINETLIREYISTVVRHEADGKIDIMLFISNDIVLDPKTATETPTTTPSSPVPATQPTIEAQVKQEQETMNTGFVLVDPNELYYPEAIALVEQDPTKSEFDEIIDLNTIPSNVEDIIKYLRAKYSIIQNAGGLRIVRSTKTSNVQRFRIYFFSEKPNNNYQIYRAVLDLNTETVQNKYFVASFELYADNHQLASKPVIQDEGLKDDTDVAYGYVTVDLALINTNPSVQKILNHLNNKYRQIVLGKNVTKIEELKLFDGRINYKILYRDPVELSEFKFIIFYQPQLDKILVLNSVNLPHHSQYNQLTV